MTPKPSNKTIATIAATALVTIAVWGAGFANVEVPGDVAAAAATIVAILIAFFVPATSGKYVGQLDDGAYESSEGTPVGNFEDRDEDPDALTVEDEEDPDALTVEDETDLEAVDVPEIDQTPPEPDWTPKH